MEKSFNLYVVFGFEWGTYNDPLLPEGMHYNEIGWELVIAESPGKAKYRVVKELNKKLGDYTDLRVYLIKKGVPEEDKYLSTGELWDKYWQDGNDFDMRFGKAFNRFYQKYGKYERVL